ncbi:MAG: hypothetical protein JSV80_08815, partial [Acidobacteriota bacterium]
DDPTWANGFGPQADEIRIYNYTRCVRGEAVPACEIRVEDVGSTLIHFHPDCPAPTFDLVDGQLSKLRADGDFSRASCLGAYTSSPAEVISAMPAAGDGHYYLARGLDAACLAPGYGSAAGLALDPRDDLDADSPCP